MFTGVRPSTGIRGNKLLNDSAPANECKIVVEYLADENIETLSPPSPPPYPPPSPTLHLVTFLFPHLKNEDLTQDHTSDQPFPNVFHTIKPKILVQNGHFRSGHKDLESVWKRTESTLKSCNRQEVVCGEENTLCITYYFTHTKMKHPRTAAACSVTVSL